MKTNLVFILGFALTGCIATEPIQVPAYSSTALAPKADKNGWYTFGDTYFKGAIVNGAPNGSGLCIDRYKSNTPRQCNFEIGNRTDSNYRVEMQAKLNDRIKQREEDNRIQEEWDRQQARREAQSRRAMDAAFSAQLNQSAQQLESLQNSFKQQDMNLDPYVAARLRATEQQREAEQYNTNSQNTGSSSESRFPLQLTGHPLPTDAEIKAENDKWEKLRAENKSTDEYMRCITEGKGGCHWKGEENSRDAERRKANENIPPPSPCLVKGCVRGNL